MNDMEAKDIHAYLKRRFNPRPHPHTRFRVLEIGAGKGTEALSKLYEVTAIEHDPIWINLYTGVNYIHAPLVDFKDGYFVTNTMWYDRENLQNLPMLGRFDAIIIDGPPGNVGRGGFSKNIDLFKSDLYIFDDTHRLWDFRNAGRVASHFNVPFKTYTNGFRWFSVVDLKINA